MSSRHQRRHSIIKPYTVAEFTTPFQRNPQLCTAPTIGAPLGELSRLVRDWGVCEKIRRNAPSLPLNDSRVAQCRHGSEWQSGGLPEPWRDRAAARRWTGCGGGDKDKAEYSYAEKTAMTYVYDANGNIVSKHRTQTSQAPTFRPQLRVRLSYTVTATVIGPISWRHMTDRR